MVPFHPVIPMWESVYRNIRKVNDKVSTGICSSVVLN